MNKVRKAETLNLSKLALSNNTRGCLKRRNLSLDELVLFGRKTAIDFEASPESINNEPKWEQELVHTLDEAGFIRHNLLKTYRVWQFYHAIFADIVESPLSTNQLYEDTPAVTDEQFEQIMDVLCTLPTREKMVIIQRFGLESGKPLGLESMGKILNCTHERIRHIQAKAIRGVKFPLRRNNLPLLFGLTAPEKPSETSVDLESIDASRLASSIDELFFSARIYYVLKRANINTVSDIINLPKENWPRVRNLGSRGLKEVEEVMRTSGFPGFSIDLS